MGESELAQRLSVANPPPVGLPRRRVRSYVRRGRDAKVKHSPLSTADSTGQRNGLAEASQPACGSRASSSASRSIVSPLR
jgi:hypothetical protein